MTTNELTVEWFDEVNGIGCATDSLGRKISLNTKNIISDGRFLTLKPLETIMCEVVKDGKDYQAKNIKRVERQIRKKERDTFLPENQIEA